MAVSLHPKIQKNGTSGRDLYQPGEAVRLEVCLEDETIWLTQGQMVELSQTSKQNISLHVNNIFKEGELWKEATVRDSLTVQIKGNRSAKRNVTYFNLDVIISVSYRVKSQRGTDFRIWATKILKEYLPFTSIYTQQITPWLNLDLSKHNNQYAPVNIRTYRQAR